MKFMRSLIAALALVLALGSGARAADYYIDMSRGLGVGTGTAADAWGSFEDAQAAFSESGARFYIGGMSRVGLKVQTPGNGVTLTQWPGKPQWGVRLDQVINNNQWVYAGTAGVFDYTIANSTLDNFTECVATVVVNWDTSIDAAGRHYGHLQLSTTNTAASMPSDSFFMTKNGSGGGTLRCKFSEGWTSTAALISAAPVVAYVPGNRNGIEIGTPTYTTYPTFGAYTDDNKNVVGLRIEFGHFYLAADTGFRSKLDSGAGEAGSTNVGTRSIGYGVRVADGENCSIIGCTFIDNGYHHAMYVGDFCRGNIFEDIVSWGGGNNPNAGNSAGAFYTGPSGTGNKNIAGCVARRWVAYVYTYLGRSGDPIIYPYNDSDAVPTTLETGSFYGSSNAFLCHTNTATGTSNGVEPGGVKYYNCKAIFSGKLSDGTLQYGSAFYGTAIGAWPFTEDKYATYPIQAFDCEVINGSMNLNSQSGSVAFVRCRLSFDRMGTVGNDVSGVGTQGGNLGSLSGTNTTGFWACEITANTDGGTKYVPVFQGHSTNRLVLINSSVYTTGTVNTGRKILFNINSTAGGVLARGCVFGFRTNHAGNVQYLTYGSAGTAYTTTRFDFLDNVYFNVSTGSYAAFDGVAPNTEASWTSTIDTTGVYLGTDAAGAWKNPWSDLEGDRLIPAGQLRSRVKYLARRVEFGINGRSYSGNYGPYQFGGEYALPEEVIADPRFTRPIRPRRKGKGSPQRRRGRREERNSGQGIR